MSPRGTGYRERSSQVICRAAESIRLTQRLQTTPAQVDPDAARREAPMVHPTAIGWAGAYVLSKAGPRYCSCALAFPGCILDWGGCLKLLKPCASSACELTKGLVQDTEGFG